MSRSQLVAMAKRHLAHVKAGTVDQAPGVYRVLAENYYEPERWRLEVDRIFKRLPLTLAFSAELREPGSYRAMLVADVPVLLTRAADGGVRAFLNVCSHRGAIVVPEGSGKARRFTCPYHAWAYDNEGALVGIYNQDDFGEVDRSCLGLTPLPVCERAGLIFAVLTPGAPTSTSTHSCAATTRSWRFHHVRPSAPSPGSQQIAGPNWKVAYDGYLDFYHLPILHKESFGSQVPKPRALRRVGSAPARQLPEPRRCWSPREDVPEEEWEPRQADLGRLDHLPAHLDRRVRARAARSTWSRSCSRARRPTTR